MKIINKPTNYTILDRRYVDVINTIIKNRKYCQLSTFQVDGVNYYCTLIMRGIFLEPHFGVFLEDKFDLLNTYIKEGSNDKIKELLSSKYFIQKDGYTDTNANLIKILSYIFSILKDYLSKKEVGFVKIMGNPRKYAIYSTLVKSNIDDFPYTIIEEIDDYYEDSFGNRLNARALCLKYNFA